MKDENKTNAQLIGGLMELRQGVAELKEVEGESVRWDRHEIRRKVRHRLRDQVAKMKSSDEIKNVLSVLKEGLHELEIPFQDCGINLVARHHDPVVVSLSSLGREGEWMPPEQAWGHDLVFQFWQAGVPVYRRDLQAEDIYGERRAYPKYFGHPVRCVLDVPFAYGTLAVNSAEPDAFSQEDIADLEQLTVVLEEGFRRREDLRSLEQRNQELAREITERKQMEQELVRLERLRAMGELSAGISHNLNNILTGVLFPAQFLCRMTDDPEILQEAEEIVTHARRAKDLVHRLHLSVRGMEEDRLIPISINEVVQEAEQTARPRWKDEPESKGIPIEVVTRLEEVPWIRGTKSRLHDILTNLLFNAVDAMPQGGTITIHTQMVDDHVRLTFSDTGIGMDGKTCSRVFEPFFTTKMEVGTGLGLSTVYNTVTQWGGGIDVDSTPGEGTTFILRLPVWKEEGIEKRKEREERKVRPGKVLVIDDEEGICSMLSRLLGRVHEVETVTDGRQALGEFVPGRYDVVFIDLGMSGVPGNHVAKEMRQRDPLVSTVLITGWELSEGDSRREPFDLEIHKPLDDLQEIEDVVAQAMELHDERVGKEN